MPFFLAIYPHKPDANKIAGSDSLWFLFYKDSDG